jgi:hypothetical protein
MGVQQPAVADKLLENCALWLCVSNYGNPQRASQPAAAIWGRGLIDEFQNVGQIYGDVILTLCLNALIGLISPQMLPRASHKRFMIVVVDLLAFESDNYPFLGFRAFPIPSSPFIRFLLLLLSTSLIYLFACVLQYYYKLTK